VQKTSGYLEIHQKGFGFLRDIENNFHADANDCFVSNNIIREFGLRNGNYLEGQQDEIVQNDIVKFQLSKLNKINGLTPAKFQKITNWKRQVSINPFERIKLTLDDNDILGKALDIIVPHGKGQRGLIISPPKAGKTTILKHIAKAVEKNHPEIKVIVLLVDERPEEVTDFRRALEKANVLSSSADESVSSHLRMTDMAMNTAICMAETGDDVIVLIDSLTRMGRAFNKETNSHGRTLSGGLAANALDLPRKFFGAARKIEHGGSLTVVASILVDTGSRMDEIIFQEFKGTGNMDLRLSQKCAERRVFPAFNINESGTRKEELIVTEDEYREILKLRRFFGQMQEIEAMQYFLDYLHNDKNL